VGPERKEKQINIERTMNKWKEGRHRKQGYIMKKRTLANVDESINKDLVMKKVRMAFLATKVKGDEDLDSSLVKPFGLSDILSVEHAVNNLQNAIKTIIAQSLDEYELDRFKAQKESLESPEVVLALQRSKLTLAAMLKTLYSRGKLNIFDQIVNFEKLQRPLASDEISLDIESHDDYDIDDNDADINEKELPPLPQIENPTIRARVFIHKSLVKDKLFISESEVIHTHNERLEFLGDSVLNNIMSQIAYNTFPNATEGQLSQLRAKLISNATLQEWSTAYGFDKELKLNVDSSIYKGKMKIYADVFEAYIGGLITENAGNYTKIYKWLKALAYPIINNGITVEQKGPKELNMSAKVELYSLIGYAGLGLHYQTVSREIQGGSSWFKVQVKTKDNEVLGTGSGKNTKEAGIRAAMAALEDKELIEKYSLLRASIPKTESKIANKPDQQERPQSQAQQPADLPTREERTSVVKDPRRSVNEHAQESNVIAPQDVDLKPEQPKNEFHFKTSNDSTNSENSISIKQENNKEERDLFGRSPPTDLPKHLSFERSSRTGTQGECHDNKNDRHEPANSFYEAENVRPGSSRERGGRGHGRGRGRYKRNNYRERYDSRF
jgi:ribonuclease-3